MVKRLEKDLPELLTFFDFPRHLWPKLGTTNDIERCFVEVGGRFCPDRQVQRDIEKPLRAVCDLVLQLDGIAQRRAAQGIGSSAVIVDESKR